MIWPRKILEPFACLSSPCSMHVCGGWGDLIWMGETCWSVTFPFKRRESEYSSFLGTLIGLLTIGYQPRNMLCTWLVFIWKSLPYPGVRLSRLKSKAHLTTCQTRPDPLPHWGYPASSVGHRTLFSFFGFFSYRYFTFSFAHWSACPLQTAHMVSLLQTFAPAISSAWIVPPSF